MSAQRLQAGFFLKHIKQTLRYSLIGGFILICPNILAVRAQTVDPGFTPCTVGVINFPSLVPKQKLADRPSSAAVLLVDRPVRRLPVKNLNATKHTALQVSVSVVPDVLA